jgi:hypothetical protein
MGRSCVSPKHEIASEKGTLEKENGQCSFVLDGITVHLMLGFLASSSLLAQESGFHQRVAAVHKRLAVQ